MSIWGDFFRFNYADEGKTYVILIVCSFYDIDNFVWNWMDWQFVYKPIVYQAHAPRWQLPNNGYFYVLHIKHQKNVQPLIIHDIHSMGLPVCSIAANIFQAGNFGSEIAQGSRPITTLVFINVFFFVPFCRVSIKEASVNKLGSICRRVYRIFSHAYFHHRTIYDEFENETFLCHRFTQFVTKYGLMSKENLIVPIEEEGNVGIVSGESEA